MSDTSYLMPFVFGGLLEKRVIVSLSRWGDDRGTLVWGDDRSTPENGMRDR